MPLNPPIQPFARGRSISDPPFENCATFIDQEIADVCVPGVSRIRKFRQRQGLTRDFLLGPLDPLRNVLDDVTVVIARSERHGAVVSARILPQELLSRALRFDEILPV